MPSSHRDFFGIAWMDRARNSIFSASVVRPLFFSSSAIPCNVTATRGLSDPKAFS